MQLQDTIIKQLGSGRFIAMTGASLFVAIESGLQFSYKGSKTSNKCRIILEESDTYTIEFFKLNVRAGSCELIASRSFVYADQLSEVFKTETGLEVRL